MPLTGFPVSWEVNISPLHLHGMRGFFASACCSLAVGPVEAMTARC
jgi:hypothetical protein